MSLTASGRKEAMQSFANSYAMNFWDRKQPKDFPTKYTVTFPDADSEKAFKEEMIQKRDKISKELREIRWHVMLRLFGGSTKGEESRIKKRGYKSKDAKKDIVKFQELYWEKEVKAAAENNGGTFVRV